MRHSQEVESAVTSEPGNEQAARANLAALIGELLVPALMATWILVYAWDLSDIPERHLNWLLLLPLMTVCLCLLVFILFFYVVPCLRAERRYRRQVVRDEAVPPFLLFDIDYRPLGVIGLLTLYISVVFAGLYIISTAVFLVACSFLLGERSPMRLLLMAVTTAVTVYLIANKLLGVELN